MSQHSPRVDPRLARFLRAGSRTHELGHGDRTLYAHLAGTYGLLKKWGNGEDVCLAGLFHSVYGTQYFKPSAIGISSRGKVRKMIGKRAERLAYLFCTCDRSRFRTNLHRESGFHLERLRGGGAVRISKKTLLALLEIELANLLEQIRSADALAPAYRNAMIRAWRKTRGRVSPEGYRSFLKFFGLGVDAARRD